MLNDEAQILKCMTIIKNKMCNIIFTCRKVKYSLFVSLCSNKCDTKIPNQIHTF